MAADLGPRVGHQPDPDARTKVRGYRRMMIPTALMFRPMTLRIAAVATLLVSLSATPGCSRSTLREDDRPAAAVVRDAQDGPRFDGRFDPRVEAFILPPQGWEMDPPKINDVRTHLTWLSPTGDTAYGVVYFDVPMIASFMPGGRFLHDKAADGYLEEFGKEVGGATEVAREYDDDLNAMRVTADGGPYRVRNVLRIRGRKGWSVYAGTLLANDVRADELAVAVAAREATRVGLDAEGGADAAAEILAGLREDAEQAAER